jgi:hypothetical protein
MAKGTQVKKRKKAETSSAETVDLVALHGRAVSGDSRPWLVEGADGHFYFLKRDKLGRDRLATEYLLSRLAAECGLPVPPVRLLRLPAELLAHSALDEAADLTPGIAFGSLRVPFGEDLRSSHLVAVPEETKLRCLCFDWWTRNPDRRLDRVGGDPNALWDPVLGQVFLIDHDRCLDPAFDPVAFRRRHAFRDARHFLERGFLEKWRTRFESAIYRLEEIWKEMPEEWLAAPGGKSALSFSCQDLAAQLMKPELAPDAILPAA